MDPETTLHRLVIARDVWLPTEKRWEREYASRSLSGELIAATRRYAGIFAETDRSEALREMELAELCCHHSRATPWRLLRVKVTVRRVLRQGEPKPNDFAGRPGLLTFEQWDHAIQPPKGFQVETGPV